MLAATEMGAIVAPPVPAFYSRPTSLQDVVDNTVGRALDLFGLRVAGLRRWSGLRQENQGSPAGGFVEGDTSSRTSQREVL
jgi:hypothetical protein